MARRERVRPSVQDWIAARSKFGLTDAQVQMARELGMNPRRLGNKSHDVSAIPGIVEALYRQRFGRSAPVSVASIEVVRREEQEARRGARAARSAAREQQRIEARAQEARALGYSVRAEFDARSGELRGVATGSRSGRLSDALLEVMKPHVPFPPARHELEEFSGGLAFGAEVWNATLGSEEDLHDLAAELSEARGCPLEEASQLVREIAASKLARFPDDRRRIVDVSVEVRGANVMVHATGLGG